MTLLPSALAQRAQEFAEELAQTLSAFLGRDVHLDATTTGDRVLVVPKTGSDLSLSVGDRKVLCVDISFRCEFDHAHDFLAIHTSEIKVHAGSRPKREPLFRYDYVHSPKDHLPGAHIQIHAHRDEFTQAMTLAAVSKAKHRLLGKEDDFTSARLSSIHFPVGGPRFRPCLEDVLQMLATEFGVTTGTGWEDHLQRSRETYRRRQTGAVVRDCPSEAVRVLRSLGYDVSEPATGPAPDRVERLRAI